MSKRSPGYALLPKPIEAPSLTAAQVATRAGVTVAQLEALSRSWWLEPTYSMEEVAQHFGCSKWQIQGLVRLGCRHGKALHPFRGGLWPTFKPSHKCRRITLSAIERHKRHMTIVHDGGAGI